LAGLVSAAEQYDERVSVPSAINSVTRANVDAKLKNSFADGLPISKRSLLNLTQSLSNTRFCPLVAQALKPFFVRPLALVLLVDDQVEHGVSVA